MTSIARRIVLVLVALFAFSFAAPASALVLEPFDDALGFIPTVQGAPAPPAIVQEGERTFLRLAAQSANGANNGVTVQQIEPLFGQVLVDFQLRIKTFQGGGRADGAGFALLNTAVAGYATGVAIPFGLAEEPAFERSLSVGFDIYESKDAQGKVLFGDLGNNHLSIHFDGKLLAVVDVGPFRDLAVGDWIRVRLIIEPATEGSDLGYVSLALTTPRGACTLLERLEVPGLGPYDAIPWFGARTGGESAHFDVDSLRIEATDPQEAGRWSTPMCWPLVPIHVVLLPTGKVLVWDRHDFNEHGDPMLWDPSTGAMEPAAAPGYDAFCSSHSLLPGGQVLVTGGHNNANGVGIARASVYDPFLDEWFRLPDMAGARWYPTNVTLKDGSVLVLSGQRNQQSINDLAEVFAVENAVWRSLTGVTALELNLYPWAYLRPDGTVLVTGPARQTYVIDPEGLGDFGEALVLAQQRDYGTSVLYAPGKVINIGGSIIGADGVQAAPTASTDLIELATAADQMDAEQGPALSAGRRQTSGVFLPSGQVLVTNGTSSPGFSEDKGAVLAVEAWTPGDAFWTSLPPAMIPRAYHSVALLLPDACVLLAGGGHPGGDTGDHPDGEIYCPPYLFTGRPRPEIIVAPRRVTYGASFELTVRSQAAPELVLIRPGAMTHGFNQNQGLSGRIATRALGDDGRFAATAPADPSLVPPGEYMLFALDRGVPSVATFVRLGETGGPPDPGAGGQNGDAGAGDSGREGGEAGASGSTSGGAGGDGRDDGGENSGGRSGADPDGTCGSCPMVMIRVIESDKEGCNCAVSPTASDMRAWWFVAAVAGWFARRRRACRLNQNPLVLP